MQPSGQIRGKVGNPPGGSARSRPLLSLDTCVEDEHSSSGLTPVDDAEEEQHHTEGWIEEDPAASKSSESRVQPQRLRRFRLTHAQTRFLMNEFSRHQHPDPVYRERLSGEIPGLSPRQVQVWFQNRAKLKRVANEDHERMLRARTRHLQPQALQPPFPPHLAQAHTAASHGSYGSFSPTYSSLGSVRDCEVQPGFYTHDSSSQSQFVQCPIGSGPASLELPIASYSIVGYSEMCSIAPDTQFQQCTTWENAIGPRVAGRANFSSLPPTPAGSAQSVNEAQHHSPISTSSVEGAIYQVRNERAGNDANNLFPAGFMHESTGFLQIPEPHRIDLGVLGSGFALPLPQRYRVPLDAQGAATTTAPYLGYPIHPSLESPPYEQIYHG